MAVQPHGLVNLINDALAWVRLVSGSIAAVQKFREISNDTSPPSFPRTKCQDLVFLYPLLILERAAFLLFSPPTIFIDPWWHSVNFYRSVSKIAADRVYSLKSRPALEKDVSNREDIKGGNGEWSYGKGTIATEWLTGTDSLSPSLLSDFLSISVLFSPALSLSPLRFHVLHLHVKLDWLQENWTVSHRNIRCLLPRILASPSPPSWYTQSVQTWPWRVVARTHPPVAACPDTNGICIFQIISRKMLSGASPLCNGPIFPSSSLLLFSVLHSLPPPQPPPSLPITSRSFGVVSLSSSLISTWVHTDVAESIPRFFPNCTPLLSPQSRKN